MNDAPTATQTDMRDALGLLSDADRHTKDVKRSTGHYLPLREIITVEDVQRWYEQSPRDELPAATPYPWETGR
jgi:hypothetical protein